MILGVGQTIDAADDDDDEGRIFDHRDLDDVVIELRTVPGDNDRLCKEPSMGSGCGRPGRQVCAKQNQAESGAPGPTIG